MPGFKFQIMVVGIRAESNFFYGNGMLLLLSLFFLFLFLVLIFAIVNYLANWWAGIGGYLN
jgi:hypothetical protein